MKILDLLSNLVKLFIGIFTKKQKEFDIKNSEEFKKSREAVSTEKRKDHYEELVSKVANKKLSLEEREKALNEIKARIGK